MCDVFFTACHPCALLTSHGLSTQLQQGLSLAAETLANRPEPNTSWHWRCLINEFSIFGQSYFAPNHCPRMRQHDWLTASQYPLRFQECMQSAFQNLVNIDTMLNALNALVNTRQEQRVSFRHQLRPVCQGLCNRVLGSRLVRLRCARNLL